MTAEQILEKHLLLMLKRTDQSYVSVDEMKQQPEWQATTNAMLEYGETQALHALVGRSEPLTCECVELGSTECNKINDKWICCKCNRPLAG